MGGLAVADIVLRHDYLVEGRAAVEIVLRCVCC